MLYFCCGPVSREMFCSFCLSVHDSLLNPLVQACRCLRWTHQDCLLECAVKLTIVGSGAPSCSKCGFVYVEKPLTRIDRLGVAWRFTREVGKGVLLLGGSLFLTSLFRYLPFLVSKLFPSLVARVASSSFARTLARVAHRFSQHWVNRILVQQPLWKRLSPWTYDPPDPSIPFPFRIWTMAGLGAVLRSSVAFLWRAEATRQVGQQLSAKAKSFSRFSALDVLDLAWTYYFFDGVWLGLGSHKAFVSLLKRSAEIMRSAWQNKRKLFALLSSHVESFHNVEPLYLKREVKAHLPHPGVDLLVLRYLNG
jgi:hypothetical protein